MAFFFGRSEGSTSISGVGGPAYLSRLSTRDALETVSPLRSALLVLLHFAHPLLNLYESFLDEQFHRLIEGATSFRSPQNVKT